MENIIYVVDIIYSTITLLFYIINFKLNSEVQKHYSRMMPFCQMR